MQWKNKTNEVLLFIIILVGFALRFYQFDELPFTWDELSAWNRLHFNHLSDLIDLGIKPDGHPAGVQVFLFYWTFLFGDTEWVVKLPFAVMGLVSVYIFYKIGEIWWNKTTALIATSFLASLQFFVLYSTIARPYISGLFLSLFMVYFWSLYMYKTPQKKYLLGFIIFAALSAYNHHFSLLFASIVGLTGLFTIQKKQITEYIISGILIFILYIPHLPIFFHQLSIGGIGGTGNWLSKPSPDFLLQFLYWVFHFSPWVIGMVLFLITIGAIQRSSKIKRKENWRKRIILLSWFSLPIIIGYYYSTLVNPVLQYSMLIFSLPYLLLFIFSGFSKLKPFFISTLIIAILAVNISTLIYERQHFYLIKKQPFNSTALCLKSQENIAPRNIFLIYNTITSYQDYYLEKYELEKSTTYSIYNKNLNHSQFDSLMLSIKQNHVLLSGLPESFVAIASKHFPYFINKTNGYTYESYLFSRLNPNNNTNNNFHQLVASSDSWKPKDHWNISQNRVLQDTLGQKYFQYTSQQEWGFSLKDSLKTLMPYYGGIIDLEADILTEDYPLHTTWVCTFSIPNKEDIWRGQASKQHLIKTAFGYRLYFSIDTRLIIKRNEFENTTFQTYFWNNKKADYKIKEIRMYIREPNPIKYGLFKIVPLK